MKFTNLKDLKPSNVQDTQERGTLALGFVQSLVDTGQDATEQTLIHGFGQGLHCKVGLLFGLGFLHHLSAHFDAGGQNSLGEVNHIDALEMAQFLGS